MGAEKVCIQDNSVWQSLHYPTVMATSTHEAGSAAASTSAVSLGKRSRSASSPAADDGERHGSSNGKADNAPADGAETDSDDDLGPMPMPEAADSGDEAGPVPAKSATAGSSKAAAKRRKVLKYEKVYLDNLPSADRYYSPS